MNLIPKNTAIAFVVWNCLVFRRVLMGFLYDVSLIALIVFSFSIQLAAIPILIAVKRIK